MQRFLVMLNDATLLRGVEGCHAAPWCWRMPTFNIMEQNDILQHHGTSWHPSTPRSSVASFNTMEQRDILQHHESLVLEDATLPHGVEGCHAAPLHGMMPRRSVMLDAQHHGAPLHPSTSRSGVTSSNTTKQRVTLQYHGAEWHPPTPRNIVASFNTTGCSVVLKDATMFRGVGGCHSAPWY
jgi:hypothetical protein